MTNKILVISYYWPPSGGAGVQRILKFVKYLPDFEITPIVITIEPKYAAFPVLDKSLIKDVNPNLEIYKTKAKDYFKFYKKLTGKNNIPHGGFTGETEKSFKSKLIRFIRGNFFIPDPRKGWNKYAFQKACEIIEKHDIKNILTTSPPHSTQLIGLKLKRKYPHINWIADFRDPWTDIYYYDKLFHTFIAKKIDKNYEKKVLQNTNHILVVSNPIKQNLNKNSGKNILHKITVIPNGYDESDFNYENSLKQEKFIITYTGTISTEYKLQGFFQALKNLDENLKNNICVRFIGSNVEIINTYNFSDNNIIIEKVNYLPHEEILKELHKSSLHLLVIPDNKNNKGILTGKLFEYLGSQKPILCLGPVDGDAAKIINDCNAGATFDYMDTNNIELFISNNIKLWLDDKKISDKYYNDNVYNYTRKNLTKKLAQIITI